MEGHVFYYCSSPSSPVNKRRRMCLLQALDRIELLLLFFFFFFNSHISFTRTEN